MSFHIQCDASCADSIAMHSSSVGDLTCCLQLLLKFICGGWTRLSRSGQSQADSSCENDWKSFSFLLNGYQVAKLVLKAAHLLCVWCFNPFGSSFASILRQSTVMTLKHSNLYSIAKWPVEFAAQLTLTNFKCNLSLLLTTNMTMSPSATATCVCILHLRDSNQ